MKTYIKNYFLMLVAAIMLTSCAPLTKEQLTAKAVHACESKGLESTDKKFSSCVSKWQEEYALQQKRAANPAWAYCTDSGFKEGTQAMATCMASWQQQHAQRGQDLMELGLEMQRIDAERNNFEPIQPIPNTRTNCTSRYNPYSKTMDTSCR